MILNFTLPRLYVCQYVNSKGQPSSFKFVPGDNKISDSEATFLIKHPGVKRRLDLGILVIKNRVTEDLVEEAVRMVKKEKSEVGDDHTAKKAKK